jgi:hypothetical protein
VHAWKLRAREPGGPSTAHEGHGPVGEGDAP